MENDIISVTLTRDNIELIYWVVTLMLLGITAFYVFYAPIKAVKIGRELSNEQNKYNSQLNLFLQLYSLRGKELNYNYVNGLNKVQIVYQDASKVITSWMKLMDEFLEKKDLDYQLIDNYKMEMFSAMAEHLGYSHLQNDQTLRPYYPKGHGADEQMNRELRVELLKFLKQNQVLTQKLILNFEAQEKSKES